MSERILVSHLASVGCWSSGRAFRDTGGSVSAVGWAPEAPASDVPSAHWMQRQQENACDGQISASHILCKVSDRCFRNTSLWRLKTFDSNNLFQTTDQTAKNSVDKPLLHHNCFETVKILQWVTTRRWWSLYMNHCLHGFYLILDEFY